VDCRISVIMLTILTITIEDPGEITSYVQFFQKSVFITQMSRKQFSIDRSNNQIRLKNIVENKLQRLCLSFA